jgi:methanethiol S-methyltransferase
MGKYLSLIVGGLSYVVAVASVVYAIGFEENLFVPKSVDTASVTGVSVAIFTNVIFLALFVAQHTIMARPAFKTWWTRYIPKHLERTVFVLASTVALALVLANWQPIPGEVWDVRGTLLGEVLMGINFFGWAIFLWSTFLINHFELFGLQQVWNNFRGTEAPKMAFKTPALYKLCRHPMMMGFMIAFWATQHMSVSHLFLTVAITVYIFIGMWFEERDLVKALGDRYRVYQQQVPKLLPLGVVRNKSLTSGEQLPADR